MDVPIGIGPDDSKFPHSGGLIVHRLWSIVVAETPDLEVASV
jgi:hypothetical protein